MKNYLTLIATVLATTFSATFTYAQTAKAASSCKMYLDNKMIAEPTLEEGLRWCELTPPTVQCDDGKVYLLQSFQISYLTLKPFLSKDFGIGEGGIPIMAKQAVKNGKPGDTLILKEVMYTDSTGTKNSLPVISLKFK